jgi:hypothetical protein
MKLNILTAIPRTCLASARNAVNKKYYFNQYSRYFNTTQFSSVSFDKVGHTEILKLDAMDHESFYFSCFVSCFLCYFVLTTYYVRCNNKRLPEAKITKPRSHKCAIASASESEESFDKRVIILLLLVEICVEQQQTPQNKTPKVTNKTCKTKCRS